MTNPLGDGPTLELEATWSKPPRIRESVWGSRKSFLDMPNIMLDK